MISHYPLASLLPWPPLPLCLDLDADGGVALQRYQPRSPDSSPRHWVSVYMCMCVYDFHLPISLEIIMSRKDLHIFFFI